MSVVMHFLFVHFFRLFYAFWVQESLPWVYGLHLRRYADPADDLDIARIIAVATRVLAQVICQVGADGASKALWSCCELTYLLVLEVAELFEVWMLQELRGSPPLILVVNEHFLNDLNSLWGYMRNHFRKALPFPLRKIDFNVRCMLAEEVEDFFAGGADYIVDTIDLV